jgi:hypothetical protein
MSAALLKSLAAIESEVAALRTALGVEGAVPAKIKTKKAKDPSAEPKAPNAWIQFTQRVGPLIKEALGKAPATVSKQFCSFLKEQKAYDQWEDEEIMEAFSTWTRPEQSKMAAKKAETASESGSVAAPKERKKREPMTEEAKALRKAKMAAKKAGNSSAEESAASEEETLRPAEAAPAAAAPVAKKLVAKKPVAKPVTYTIEQLADFDFFDHDGTSYGRNARGDVADDEGEFVGHWDGKTVTKTEVPADWAAVMAAM